MGKFNIKCSGHCNEDLTETVQIACNGTNVFGVTYGTNNNENEYSVDINTSSDYQIDITQTEYTGGDEPLPVFYHIIIVIKNTSGCDGNLDIQGQFSLFDGCHYKFDYNGNTYSDTTNLTIQDYGPSPTPAYIARGLCVCDGVNSVMVSVPDDVTSYVALGFTFVNCYNYCHSGTKTMYFNYDFKDTYTVDSAGNIDLMSLTMTWDEYNCYSRKVIRYISKLFRKIFLCCD